jgi:hypothetical protein
MPRKSLLGEMQSAFLAGDDHARLAWADAFEEAGDDAGARALRELPGLFDVIAATLAALQRVGVPQHFSSVWLNLWKLTRVAEWECHTSLETPANVVHRMCALKPTWGESPVVYTLLTRWNGFRPAVAWLARRLSLPFVAASRHRSIDVRRYGLHLTRSQDGEMLFCRLLPEHHPGP